jgi:glycosyltransferase involved in cell wall biosynthesis
VRVAIHATTDARCGIAEYVRDLRAGLGDGVDAEVVPIRPGRRNPLAMLPVARRLNAADLTHIHHNYGFWGRGSLSYRLVLETLQRAIRIPVVLTPHSVFPPRPAGRAPGPRQAVARALGLHAFIDRGTFAFADRIIVHSRCHARLLRERGIPADRLVEIMPGVPVVQRPPAEAVARHRRTGGLDRKRVIGVFGFIQPNKRYELPLRALAELPPDIVLLLIGGARTPGEEPYVAQLRELARTLGVEPRVRITGFLPRDELAVPLSAVDLFVLPYATDHSVSYSARLCLAYEKPILASAVEGFQELKERYACVELFKASDPAELARDILALLGDPARRAALAEAARRYGERRSWRRVAAETLEVYRSVLATGQCASSS